MEEDERKIEIVTFRKVERDRERKDSKKSLKNIAVKKRSNDYMTCHGKKERERERKKKKKTRTEKKESKVNQKLSF